LFKIIFLGYDKAEMTFDSNKNKENNEKGLEEDNEVKRFLDARYVSSAEACWRIFGFPLHEQYPCTKRLSIHLQDQQNIRFTDGEKLKDVIEKTIDTQLTAYFKINDEGTDLDALNLSYHEMPKYYTWDNSSKKWNKRKK
jgi:ATP-dependent DNA helicase PIF1